MTRSPRGSALVMSLFMVMLFSIMAATIFSIVRSQMRESVYRMRAAQAQSIAEAGVDDALYQLRVSTGWRAGFSQKSFAGGAYSVTLSSEPAPLITSTGYSRAIVFLGPVARTVSARARITLSSAAVHVEVEPGTWAL